MSARKIRMVVNGWKLEWRETKSGLSHGSVLQPVMVLTCMNDRMKDVDRCNSLLADDHEKSGNGGRLQGTTGVMKGVKCDKLNSMKNVK